MDAALDSATRAPYNRRHERLRRAEQDIARGTDGVLTLRGARSDSADSSSDVLEESFAGVVHDGGRAAWGPSRATVAEAQQDRVALTLALEKGTLLQKLAAMKSFGGTIPLAEGPTKPLLSVIQMASVVEDLFGDDSDGELEA
jgi:hypothetical protein